METDDELLSKGLARDIIRRVQAKRKTLDLDIEAKISLSVWIEESELFDADWAHVKIETRTHNGTLNAGKPDENSESFMVDQTRIFFQIDINQIT